MAANNRLHILQDIQRATAFSGELAITPLRLLGPLSEPMRMGANRQIRRTLGVQPMETVEGRISAGYLPDDAVARRVQADVGAMMIGGVSALFLQTLHPLVMAGVADHSAYRSDPLGRLQRTADYVATTTYGSTEQAEAMFATVRRVHQFVHGTASDGRPYRADDPELVTWVHVTEISSFLHGAQRFGAHRFTPAECDQYWLETAPLALELGAQWAPSSSDQARDYFRRMRPSLYMGSQARSAREFLLRGPAQRVEERAVYAVIVAAAIGLLPRWARRELEITQLPLVDSMVVVPAARVLCAAVRWAVETQGI